jgi:hypothetical protein
MNQPSLPKIEPLGLTIEELLKKRDDDLANLLAPLKFHEVLEVVRQTPWKDKARVILLSPYPEGVVKNLHPAELFFTMKASSLDLAVELLSYAKGSQVQFFFDLDAWYKDRIKAERVASWIVLLFSAGEDKVLEWLRVADWDFLIALFQKFIKVFKRSDDVDLLEAYDWLPPYTLDDVYFIDFKVDELEFYFRRMIEILREEMPEQYFSLLESVIWEIPLEVEERAYRFRNARLEDEGLVDYFSALEIYSPLHPKRIRAVEEKFALLYEGEVEHPLFLVLVEDRGFLIERALAEIKDPLVLNRIKRELAYLTTKLVIADFVVIDGLKEMEETTKKLWPSLNLGLDYLSHGRVDLAKEFLTNYYLEDIFQVGQTALRELRRYAMRVLTSKDFDPILLRYLDQPYSGYIKGIMVKKLNQIKLFQPERFGTAEEYTYFSRESEVKMVWRYIEEVGYLATLLDKAFGGTGPIIKEMLEPDRNFDLLNLTWSAIVLTSLAQWLLTKDFRFKAIPKKEWKRLFPMLMEKRGERSYFSEELKEALKENFRALAQATYFVEPSFIESFVENLAQRMEAEFAFAEPSSPPDPKYQTLILIDLKG